MNEFALDTNVLIYGHDSAHPEKREIARNLIVKSPVLSAQVVSEYINVLKRLKQLPKDTLLDLCIPVIENCRICPVDTSTLRKAQQLVRHYNFQIFDSIIVASAIEAGCETLYSEDMQHNLRVEDRLRIINPFIL